MQNGVDMKITTHDSQGEKLKILSAQTEKMKLSIRIAEINDSEPIAKLSGQLGYVSNHNETRNRLIEILKNSDNCVYVAVDNNKIIGWIHGFYALRVETDSFVEIGGLIVDENCRNMGVGKILIEKTVAWAHSKNCNHIRVRCNELRKESHAFYRHIGFQLNKMQMVFAKKLD